MALDLYVDRLEVAKRDHRSKCPVLGLSQKTTTHGAIIHPVIITPDWSFGPGASTGASDVKLSYNVRPTDNVLVELFLKKVAYGPYLKLICDGTTIFDQGSPGSTTTTQLVFHWSRVLTGYSLIELAIYGGNVWTSHTSGYAYSGDEDMGNALVRVIS